MKKILSILTLTVAVVACGKVEIPKKDSDSSTPSPFGRFGSAACWKNKLASMGGGDIYTVVEMEFKADGTGVSSFHLYDEATCTNELFSGQQAFMFSFINTFGSVLVVQIDQLNDPNDPNSNMRYWMQGILTQGGYTLDANYSSGTSGPFLAAPDANDANAFLADLDARGVFLSRL